MLQKFETWGRDGHHHKVKCGGHHHGVKRDGHHHWLNVTGTITKLNVTGTITGLNLTGTITRLNVAGTITGLNVAGTITALNVAGTITRLKRIQVVSQVIHKQIVSPGDALSAFKGGNRTLETSSIFTTYPQSYLSVGNGLGDQMFGTALLMLLVLALGDPKNMAPQKGFVPLVVGLIVVAIGMTFSYNCGYAINPARDLSPRIFVFMAGWGRQVFSHNNYQWFWIPVIGPHLGAIIGGAVYEMFINNTIPGFDWSICGGRKRFFASLEDTTLKPAAGGKKAEAYTVIDMKAAEIETMESINTPRCTANVSAPS
ncbi:Aquaporin-7 [Bulinus truncatus]|nr:Aquaporin-7 [Bulinus truncatus]